jgi:hypothetical protein
MHNGAQFTQAILTFFVGQNHAGVPISLPKFRIIAVDQFGNVVGPWHVGTSSNGDAQGYVQPTPPGSGAAWYNGGAAQTIVFNPNNPVNPVIDTAHTYFAQIIDEAGTNALPLNLYSDVQLLFTGLDCRPW